MNKRMVLAAIGGIAFAVGLILQAPFIAAAGGVVAVGALLVQSFQQTQKAVETSILDRVSNNNRVRLKPLKNIHDEIQSICSAAKGNAAVTVIGAEAVLESKSVLDRAITLLNMRENLVKLTAGNATVQTSIEELRAHAEVAEAGPEKEAMEAAASARANEADHYAKIQQAIERIDSHLRQAEAGLGNLKSRLALAAAGGAVESTDELRDSLMRLKDLQKGVDEAEEFLKETST